MSSFEILRRVTKPTTDAKVMEYARARYGAIRDTIGSDDPVTAERIAATSRRIAAKRVEAGSKSKPAFG